MLILFFVCLWCITKIFTQHTCHLRSASKCFVKVLYFYVESINLDICYFLSDSHFPLLPRHYVLHNTWMLWCELHCTWCRVVFLRIMCNCACCWTITLTASVKTINVTAEMSFLIVNCVNKVSKKKQNWRTQNMYSTYYQYFAPTTELAISPSFCHLKPFSFCNCYYYVVMFTRM